MNDRTRSTRSSGTSRSERGGRDSGRSTGGRYEYKPRDASATKKRSDQSGFGDKDTYLSDAVKLFKVNDGDNIIRILPPTWEGAEHFGLDIFVHFGVGPDRQTYLCLHKMKGEKCPICEEKVLAQKDGDEDFAKQLEPKKRVLVYIVDRDNEKEGVKAWPMPWTVDRDICKVSVDKRTGESLELDNPEQGYDVEFEKKGAKERTEYLGVAIARRDSPLGDDEWLNFAMDNPLPTLLTYYSYENIAAELNGGGGRDDKPSGRGKKDLDQEQEEGLRESERKGARHSSRSHDDDLTFEGVHGMTFDELCSIIDDRKLDIDPDKSKDDDDLADWVCDELKLKEEVKKSSRRSVPKDEEGESPKDRLKSMRNKRER